MGRGIGPDVSVSGLEELEERETSPGVQAQL